MKDVVNMDRPPSEEAINAAQAYMREHKRWLQELEERVAALEKAYASWLPDWAATQERVARLERYCDAISEECCDSPLASEQFEPRGPHD